MLSVNICQTFNINIAYILWLRNLEKIRGFTKFTKQVSEDAKTFTSYIRVCDGYRREIRKVSKE